jgi:hypothetical protein
LSRAQRPAGVAAVIENAGNAAVEIEATLILPDGVKSVALSLSASVGIWAALKTMNVLSLQEYHRGLRGNRE